MTIPSEEIGSDRLGVSIDRDAEVPVGVQLGWALCSRIRDGSFKPGQRLPTLRETAEASGLNINTVRAVYQRLEQKGLIESQQGSGTFVAPIPPKPSDVASIAAHAAHEAHETGVDPRDVAAALYVAREPPIQPASEPAALSEIDRRQLLRRQIAAFERALGEIETEYPGVAPATTQTHRGFGPALLSARELEHVRALLVRRLATVQTAIDEYGGVSANELEPQATTAPKHSKSVSDAAKTRKRASRPRSTTRPAPAST